SLGGGGVDDRGDHVVRDGERVRLPGRRRSHRGSRCGRNGCRRGRPASQTARRPAEETRWVIRRTLGRAASAGGQRVRKGGWKAGAHAVPEGGEAVWPTGVGARGRRRSEAKR